MRKNTDIELPKIRVRIHILCETYARAQSVEERSRVLNDIELMVFHAADLLAWDIVDAQRDQLSPDHAHRTEVSPGNKKGDSRSIAA
ncbi:hypothetical protein [Caulobacter mirabilis]|uniref:hypothetical protein n=1 Tax=Caulobacter mirabilis TaxID=69666 RepID=UPI0015594DFC|nr:hypothetical protein [Caulobacter mirabilis]